MRCDYVLRVLITKESGCVAGSLVLEDSYIKIRIHNFKYHKYSSKKGVTTEVADQISDDFRMKILRYKVYINDRV